MQLGKIPGRLFIHLLVWGGGLSMLIPFLWMVSTSLKTDAQAFAWPPQFIPNPMCIRNYLEAWQVAPFERFFLNSLIVSVSITLVSLFCNSLAGYAFAKYRFPGRNIIFILVLCTMMIPFQVTMIPVFVILKWFHWLDTYRGLIVPGFASAFGIFFMRQFMTNLPSDLMDAARIDGCSEFRTYWQVVLPLCKPALATLAVFTFMGAWNDFLWPLIVVKSDSMRTLPLAISALSSGHYVMSWPLLMAGATFVILPVIVAFLFAQRYFVRAIVMGGLKG